MGIGAFVLKKGKYVRIKEDLSQLFSPQVLSGPFSVPSDHSENQVIVVPTVKEPRKEGCVVYPWNLKSFQDSLTCGHVGSGLPLADLFLTRLAFAKIFLGRNLKQRSSHCLMYQQQ